MNLFADLRNIIILALMIVSGIAGYYIGSYKGRDAIEVLEKIKSATAQEQQAHDAAQNADWDEIKADKDKRIAELSGAISANQTVIQHLIQLESTKQVGSKERLRLDNQIAKLENKESDEKTAISGEKCVDTVVPIEIVKMLREVQ
jgi:hypothetical protein